MDKVENIEEIERRLWSSADTLRANGNFASNEGFLPIMGLIFLRHAYSRYLSVLPDIKANRPTRGGVPRPITKEDFSGRSAIYLREEAQFDHLLNLTDSNDRAEAIMKAMEMIEEDYDALAGVLPKREYQELDNEVLGTLLRAFNDSALKGMTGDVFGRIYEYFITKFADQGAHDNGEFFTPVSLVQMIVNVIEPDHGNVIDPACGSGGMFVQSAHFIERLNRTPKDVVTFYGMEKNTTTVRLAKMNMAVHGLEGNIVKAISYYQEPHNMVGKCDFVMANPPFNVDEVDAAKVKNDSRLPFDLPGVNKKGQVSNGNYLWISYFYSYLNETGRAGFVMSSQASSAGGEEANVRRKMIETGYVDAMIAIRSNFFYTRSVPCELWFLDKGKANAMKHKVLMIDARKMCRQVTRRIYDFSPEQTLNLAAIFWLYRGQQGRFLGQVARWLQATISAAQDVAEPFAKLVTIYRALASEMVKVDVQALEAQKQLSTSAELFQVTLVEVKTIWKNAKCENEELLNVGKSFAAIVEASLVLIERIDQSFSVMEPKAKEQIGNGRKMSRLIKDTDAVRRSACDALRRVQYFYNQARWLQERFPDAELCDIEGLVKLVDWSELEEHEWSLTPGRYVGVATDEESDNVDYREVLRNIHTELAGLNQEANDLAAQVQKNFKELGV